MKRLLTPAAILATLYLTPAHANTVCSYESGDGWFSAWVCGPQQNILWGCSQGLSDGFATFGQNRGDWNAAKKAHVNVYASYGVRADGSLYCSTLYEDNNADTAN